MFENLSIEALQAYWWIIVSLLGSILVFLMFVQGGQSLLRTVAKTEDEKVLVLNTIGTKWEFTFTTLVTFGGAFFAAFPLFYSTSFGGAYWVWILLLFSFIVQAVSYEFRSKPGNFVGSSVYEWFLIANGVIAPLVVGAAVGTFFTGSQFSVNDMNLSRWMCAGHGLEALLNTTNVTLGATILLLSRQLGAMYLINSLDNEAIVYRAKRQIRYEAIPFLVLAVLFVLQIVISKGFSVDEHGVVSMVQFKYLTNLIQMPVVLILFLIGLVGIILGIFVSVFKNNPVAFWITGLSSISLAMSLFMLVGFNGTAYYPSTFNIQQSLTLQNSSSSHYTLTAMSYVSLFVPFVLAYIIYVWKEMNKKQLTTEMMKEEDHKY